jgi:hypothetical protein
LGTPLFEVVVDGAGAGALMISRGATIIFQFNVLFTKNTSGTMA